MISRDAIIRAYPLDAYLTRMGRKIEKKGANLFCLCPFHADKNPSMLVDLEKQHWHCFACNIGGSIIDLEMRTKGMSFKDAIASLATAAGIEDEIKPGQRVKVATYDYKDQHGRKVFSIDRIEESGGKKTFAQYHEDQATGERINGIKDVQRVLYRLERWSGKEDVALCEGEKCVHALEQLGIDATTNSGGSSGWLPAYSAFLSGKRVEIWPDNDEPGEKWLKSVLASLEGKVAALRVLRVESIYNDIADVVDAQGVDHARETVEEIRERVRWIDRGVDLPLLSAREARDLYAQRVRDIDAIGVDLGKWLPTLRSCSRKLLPGDLGLFLSDTGVGKTSALLNIAYSQSPMPTIIFELELAPEAMIERQIARQHGIDTLEVERETMRGHNYDVARWSHVYICPESRMDGKRMRDIIARSELKIGAPPGLILVDYVGLMDGPGGNRYERMSAIAEDMKRLARETNTVVFIASQVKRDSERLEIGLHDSKDSGSIENSSQLVLGAWRPSVDRIMIRVLKQTKRAGQFDIECIFDGNRQVIAELDRNGGRE